MDRQGANYCGRLWWMLKWCGHEAVAVLDGGLAAWEAAGGRLETGPSAPPAPGNFTPGPTLARTQGAQEIFEGLGHPDLTLVDARAAARFRGEVEPLDPVAGHIPGALNRPFAENLGPDGHFKPAEQLAQRVRTAAGRARPCLGGPSLRQRGERDPQPAGDGDRRTGSNGPVPRQLERMVQHTRAALREDLSSQPTCR